MLGWEALDFSISPLKQMGLGLACLKQLHEDIANDCKHTHCNHDQYDAAQMADLTFLSTIAVTNIGSNTVYNTKYVTVPVWGGLREWIIRIKIQGFGYILDVVTFTIKTVKSDSDERSFV